MTDSELIDLMRDDKSLLNNVRRLFSHKSALIDQATRQKRMPSIIEIRRMEFQAAQELIDLIKKVNDIA